jgi:radical SAM additional 4Fe4S-binding domain
MSKNKTSRAAFLKKLEIPNSLNVIFQLTDRCVLSCKYCFAKGSHSGYGKKTSMSKESLARAIRQSFDTHHKKVVFEWTGGEPLLAGIDFYKNVNQIQQKYANKNFHNVVQTSGYLSDKKLIDFLVKNRFHLSTTIDGPEDIHNFQRPACGNKPSLSKILKTRDYIVEKQGTCGAICTITKKSMGKEAQILKYYRLLKIKSFHSNPYIFFSKNFVKDKSIALTNEDYASYFINQFNAWFEQGKKRPIPATIDYILHGVKAKEEVSNAICTFGGRCLTNFIAIAPGGDAYTCPKFIGMETMSLGNINKATIAHILSDKSPPMSKIINERISAINKCEKENCQYLYLCNSGCPYYSFISSDGKNIKEKDFLCSGKKLIYQYLKSVVDALISSNIKF